MRHGKREKPKKIKKAPITITELIATNKTAEARKLLKSYGKQDAIGYGDLQMKLSELYRETPDKLEIERAVANMHPHKEFILKYCAPAPVEPADIPRPSDIEVQKLTKNMTIVDDGYSNADGNGRRHSCSCGCSNFDGTGGARAVNVPDNNSQTTLIAALAMVSIVALIIYSKK